MKLVGDIVILMEVTRKISGLNRMRGTTLMKQDMPLKRAGRKLKENGITSPMDAGC